ncbi:MAG: Xaa-Pro dipeptidase [Thermoanaerobaculia bacterium]
MPDNLGSLYASHIETLRKRHDDALQKAGFDHVVVYSGFEHGQFVDDQPYPFRVNPHFKFWVPLISTPESFVVYTPGRKPVLVYFQPVDYWYKPPQDPRGFWVDQFDIRVVANPEDAIAHMPASGRTALIGEWSGDASKWRIAEVNPKAIIEYLHYHRAWKTPYELECMRRATVLGIRAHKAAARAFREGMSEFEINAVFMNAASLTESELPYGNIVALNENASVLHYQHLNRERLPEDARHSFLLDAGATYNGYACDITRTWSQRDDEFKQLIAAVEVMELEIVDEIRPGVDYRDIQAGTHRKVGAILNRFGFVDIDGDAAFEKKITPAFFPHGVGHLLGLQVHDVGGFSKDESGATIPKPEGQPYLRLTRVVEEGQVFTIEPGIYFIDPLLKELKKTDVAKHVNWPKVDAFRKYGGIRIEDNVVVTRNGRENMTRELW